MYSKLEVIEMLVHNFNAVMDLVDESKTFKINYADEIVECHKKSFLGTRITSTDTFDKVIREANGVVR